MNQVTIPKSFEKSLIKNEVVLAITQKHNLWILAWWLKPVNLILGVATIGLLFLYKKHLMGNEVIILTNKRVIGAISPKLFTKDKLELTIKSIDNIEEDETFFGNIFNWTAVKIVTHSRSYQQRIITKTSLKYLKDQFYDLQD